MDKDNKIVFILIASVVLLFVLVLVKNRVNNQSSNISLQQSPQENQEESTVTQESVEPLNPVAVSFQASSMEISLDDTGEAIVMLDENEEAPTAFYLHLRYDPEIIDVQEVEVGGLWESNNVLEEEIDEELGEIKMSVGQGFEAQKTGDTEMLKITFKLLENENAENVTMYIVEDSSLYYAGLDRGRPVESVPLTVNISQ